MPSLSFPEKSVTMSSSSASMWGRESYPCPVATVAVRALPGENANVSKPNPAAGL